VKYILFFSCADLIKSEVFKRPRECWHRRCAKRPEKKRIWLLKCSQSKCPCEIKEFENGGKFFLR
jgi:hypothetical protein